MDEQLKTWGDSDLWSGWVRQGLTLAVSLEGTYTAASCPMRKRQPRTAGPDGLFELSRSCYCYFYVKCRMKQRIRVALSSLGCNCVLWDQMYDLEVTVLRTSVQERKIIPGVFTDGLILKMWNRNHESKQRVMHEWILTDMVEMWVIISEEKRQDSWSRRTLNFTVGLKHLIYIQRSVVVPLKFHTSVR